MSVPSHPARGRRGRTRSWALGPVLFHVRFNPQLILTERLGQQGAGCLRVIRRVVHGGGWHSKGVMAWSPSSRLLETACPTPTPSLLYMT